MGLLDILVGDNKKDEEDKLKEEFIKNEEQDEINFEEEELEEDDFHFDDDTGVIVAMSRKNTDEVRGLLPNLDSIIYLYWKLWIFHRLEIQWKNNLVKK